MALKKIGRYNLLDADALVPLPPKNTIIKFSFGEPTLDPVTKKMRYAEAVKVPSVSKCWNPDANGGTGEWVDIGLVTSIHKDTGDCTGFVPIWAEPNKNSGFLYVVIGSPAADSLYQYLMLHSSNSVNLLRDPEAKVLYHYVDDARIAKDQIMNRRTKRTAVNMVSGLAEGAELVRAAFLCGINADRDPEVVLNDLETLAETNPKLIIECLTDPNADIKNELLKGLNLGTIIVDPTNLQLRWKQGGQHPILNLGSPDLDSVKNTFAAFVNSDEKGQGVLDQLETLNDSVEKMQARKAASITGTGVGGYPEKKPLFIQEQERQAAAAAQDLSGTGAAGSDSLVGTGLPGDPLLLGNVANTETPADTAAGAPKAGRSKKA